jgi:hypothetical protein
MTRPNPPAKPTATAKRQSGATIPRSERESRGQSEVHVRLGPKQLAWLDGQIDVDEGRATALRRLAGVPDEKDLS